MAKLSDNQKLGLRVVSTIAVGHVISKTLSAFVPVAGPIDTIVTIVGNVMISSYISGEISEGTVRDTEALLEEADELMAELKQLRDKE